MRVTLLASLCPLSFLISRIDVSYWWTVERLLNMLYTVPSCPSIWDPSAGNTGSQLFPQTGIQGLLCQRVGLQISNILFHLLFISYFYFISNVIFVYTYNAFHVLYVILYLLISYFWSRSLKQMWWIVDMLNISTGYMDIIIIFLCMYLKMFCRCLKVKYKMYETTCIKCINTTSV
jgi:hypothetical protein